MDRHADMVVGGLEGDRSWTNTIMIRAEKVRVIADILKEPQFFRGWALRRLRLLAQAHTEWSHSLHNGRNGATLGALRIDTDKSACG